MKMIKLHVFIKGPGLCFVSTLIIISAFEKAIKNTTVVMEEMFCIQ